MLRAQTAAFKDGYSFNTLLKGADLRDALRVRKSNNTTKIAGGKTTATVEGNATKVCVVSAQKGPPVTRHHQIRRCSPGLLV